MGIAYLHFTRELPDGEQIDLCLEVWFNYYAGCRGQFDKYGAQETPDDPEDLEITNIFNEDTGEELEFTKEESQKLEEKIFEHIENNADGP